jgi:hypothetical protein
MEPDIAQWMGGAVTDGERDDIIHAVRWSSDGYDRARELDRKGWAVDAALVELLSDVDGEIYRAHATAVKQWIDATGARPHLNVGASVVLPAGVDAGAAGEIISVSEIAGSYTVFVPSLGHVRDGLGTHGRIFAWEMLEAANASALEPAVDPSWSIPKKN